MKTRGNHKEEGIWEREDMTKDTRGEADAILGGRFVKCKRSGGKLFSNKTANDRMGVHV
jgi:hypothetical protein